MIWQSAFWKRDLLKRASYLRGQMRRKKWREDSMSRLEQHLMLGFYAIRKLTDSGKLTDVVATLQVPLVCYPVLPDAYVTRINWHWTEKLYDMDSPAACSLDLRQLCNQFIHSYVFTLMFDEHGCFDGALFSSDRDRNERALVLTAAEIVALFELVGHDELTSFSATWDERLGDYSLSNQ